MLVVRLSVFQRQAIRVHRRCWQICAFLIAAVGRKCTGVSPELRIRTVRKVSAGRKVVLRGRRSTGHEEREIDKAHVLRAAESPWLEVSTVGLSCRLLIAGTMQQMALIAIPTRSSHSRILLCSSYLSLSLSSSHLSRYFALLSSLLRCFSHIFPRGPPPPPPRRRFDPTSRATPCVRFHIADKRAT